MIRDQGWEGSEHYRELGLEPWSAMEHWLTPEEFKGFLKGCAIKRLARANTKGDELLDITKAIHELQKAKEVILDSIKVPEELEDIHGYSWAVEQMDAGKRVRRQYWDPGAYICRAGIPDDDSKNKYLRNESGVAVVLKAVDIAALDWEALGGQIGDSETD